MVACFGSTTTTSPGSEALVVIPENVPFFAIDETVN